MGDSESEKDVGSDVDGSDVDDNEPAFDPKELEKMSEKDRKKWEKNLQKWRIFMDFLVRHVAIATFKYNCFECEELQKFLMALDKAELLRSQTKLKKGEDPKITSFKSMKEASELLMKQKFVTEAVLIRKFLDIAGRMRGIGMIAGGFYKALKKGKVHGLEKLKYYLDYWKGFCVRSYNFSELQFQGIDLVSLNDLERKHLAWPTVVRTSLNLSQKFLKRASESTGLDLISADQATMQQHMQAAEFVVATKIEDMLFQKVVHETKSFLIGGSALLHQSGQATSSGGQEKWDLPSIEDIDPAMIKPIPENGRLLVLPPDPPKEKKKGKKKGSGKGKKAGRSFSASSHKPKKKKK